MSKIRYGKTINYKDYVTLPKNFHLNGSIRTNKQMTFKVQNFAGYYYKSDIDLMLELVNPTEISSNDFNYNNKWGINIHGDEVTTLYVLKQFIETKKIRVAINKFSKSFMNTNPFSKTFSNELIHNQLDDLLL